MFPGLHAGDSQGSGRPGAVNIVTEPEFKTPTPLAFQTHERILLTHKRILLTLVTRVSLPCAPLKEASQWPTPPAPEGKASEGPRTCADLQPLPFLDYASVPQDSRILPKCLLPGPASTLLWVPPPKGELSPFSAPLAPKNQREVICSGM